MRWSQNCMIKSSGNTYMLPVNGFESFTFNVCTINNQGRNQLCNALIYTVCAYVCTTTYKNKFEEKRGPSLHSSSGHYKHITQSKPHEIRMVTVQICFLWMTTNSAGYTVCDFIMLTFRSYRMNGTTIFLNGGETYAPAVQRNDRRTLRFQMIQRANLMATRVQLRSFQSSTNASIVSPVSDHSIAHEIITFCNCSNAVRKTAP